MALIWCDGFDQYGSAIGNMTDGFYAQISGMTLSTAQVRTGARSLAGGGFFRWVLPEARSVVGQGMAIYLNALPDTSDRIVLFQGRDGDNNSHLTVTVMTTGALRIRRGGAGGTLLHETGPVLTAEAWHHVEIKTVFDNTNGAVEIRVNGVTVADIADVDTVDISSPLCHQLVAGELNPTSATLYIDDYFVWDDQGDHNNDFLGDHRVRLLMPNQDTAEDDFDVTGAAAGYQAIDEVPPDDDTSYIAADTVGDVSEFGFEDLPASVSSIAGLMVVGRMRKTDAGTCNVQMGLVSGGFVTVGADRPITEQWTYWSDVLDLDPDTGAAWTRESANAALLRFERTA